MQLMVLEYAQHVLKLKDASSEEINPKAKHLVIAVQASQKDLIKNKKMGGTMRLGQYEAKLAKGSLAQKAYKADSVLERHRHRYEVNVDYIEQLVASGLDFTGISPDGELMEIAELSKEDHPFFMGVQFHPELQARPLSPHPLFTAFVKASYETE
jgi:CTP synthase